jgi:hypothetical protein
MEDSKHKKKKDLNELLELGIKKRNHELKHENGKEYSWDYIGSLYGKTGEQARNYVRNHVRKNLHKVDKNVKEEVEYSGTKVGQEEIKPKYIDMGDYYSVHSGKRKIIVTKENLRKIKEMYCDDSPLTINQICRELEMPRPEFFVVKTAFSITHDDVPYIDEDLMSGDIEELVDETLEKRKKIYHNKLQQKEIEVLKNEVVKYRKKDYFYNKVIKEMSIPIKPLTFKPRFINSSTEAQLNLADWHTGLQTDNYWNKYNLQIQEQRILNLVDKVLTYIKRHNVKILHVMNLGDLLHGIIHVSTRVTAEVDIIQQFRITWQLISNMLEILAREVEVVYFYSTYGNHSRITANKNEALDMENFELLLPDVLKASLQIIPNIQFVNNEIDDQILIADICGHVVCGVHGDRDKNEKVAQNLTMMLPEKPYKIFTAHTHHKEVLEVHKVDVIVSRSLCGVENYAKGIRSTSRAGQSFYVYTNEGLECIYDITFN